MDRAAGLAALIDAANARIASLEAAHIAAVAGMRRARAGLQAQREAIVGPASAKLRALLNADAFDLAMITACLDEGGDVDREVCGEMPPLQKAVGRMELETVRLLLDRGAGVNLAARSSLGWTALLTVCSDGDQGGRWGPSAPCDGITIFKVARLLLARGADPNQACANDCPLFCALENQYPDTHIMADWDDGMTADGNDWAPAVLAVTFRDDMTRLLLMHGADPNVKRWDEYPGPPHNPLCPKSSARRDTCNVCRHQRGAGVLAAASNLRW